MRPVQLQQISYVSIALGRLRRGVNVCCWITALALMVQLLVWCVVSFTNMRFESIEDTSRQPLVITSGDGRKPGGPNTGPDKPKVEIRTADAEDMPVVDPNQVLSKHDRMLARSSELSKGAGTMAMFPGPAAPPWRGAGARSSPCRTSGRVDPNHRDAASPRHVG